MVGYKQQEKRRKLEAEETVGAMKQSSLAQYLVLKPTPLDTPPPIKLCLYLSL